MRPSPFGSRLWTFARSWHVERRLRAGLEVDEPKLSILANFRGS